MRSRTIYWRVIASVLFALTLVLVRLAVPAPTIEQTGYSHSAHVSPR